MDFESLKGKQLDAEVMTALGDRYAEVPRYSEEADDAVRIVEIAADHFGEVGLTISAAGGLSIYGARIPVGTHENRVWCSGFGGTLGRAVAIAFLRATETEAQIIRPASALASSPLRP